MRLLLAFSSLCLLLAAAQEPDDPPGAGERRALELTYLANEGFLAKVGERSVLFDAFLARPYAGYPALPDATLTTLREAEAPFDNIDLALTSHYHGDHLQTSVAASFLRASPTTSFASTPEAVQLLCSEEDWPQSDRKRLFSHYPKAGQSEVVAIGEIELEFLRVRHAGGHQVQNLGLIVRMEGHTLLHLGDADLDPAIYTRYAHQLAQVDLVLAPMWFYGNKRGEEILRIHFPDSVRVAMHFPRQRLASTVRSFLENHPKVKAFQAPLEVQRFP